MNSIKVHGMDLTHPLLSRTPMKATVAFFKHQIVDTLIKMLSAPGLRSSLFMNE